MSETQDNFKAVHRRYKSQATNYPIINYKRSLHETQSKIATSLVRPSRRYRTEADQFRTPSNSFSKSKESKPIQSQFRYNKWYIRPEYRLKDTIKKKEGAKDKNDEYIYDSLYQSTVFKEDKPFEMVANQKIQFLERIPIQNVKLLKTFKKNQEINHKRVPKIIELFLKSRCSNDFSNKNANLLDRLPDQFTELG